MNNSGPNVTPVAVNTQPNTFYTGGVYTVPVGPKTYMPTKITTQNVSNSQVSFNIPVPHRSACLNRNVKIEYDVEIAFSGTAGGMSGGKLINRDVDAPRFMPMTSCMTSATATINNATISWNPTDALHPLVASGLSLVDQEAMSECPSMPDKTQNYNDPFNLALYPEIAGPQSNVLTTIGNCPQQQLPRGSHPLEILSNTATSAVVRFKTIEPLMLSPFDANPNDQPIAGLQTLLFTFNFGDLRRVWSHNDISPYGAGATLVIDSVNIIGNPTAHVLWTTPNDVIDVPDKIEMAFNNITATPTELNQAIAPGAEFTITSNNIQLQSIPSRILVCADQLLSQKTMSTCDSFPELLDIALYYDIAPAQNTTADKYDNWRQNYKLGYTKNFVENSTMKGTVFIIEPSKNLPMTNLEDAPGAITNRMFYVTARFRNIDRNTYVNPKKFRLMIIQINSGTITIENGTAMVSNVLLTPQQIVAAVENVQNTRTGEQLQAEADADNSASRTGGSLYGRGFGKTIMRAMKPFKKIVKDNKLISKGIAAAGGPAWASNITQRLGYGFLSNDQLSGRLRQLQEKERIENQ